MNIPESTLNQLFKGLGEYNPTTNEIMEKIAKVLQPLGIAILAILFLIELSDQAKKFNRDDGGMTIEVLANIGLKYLIGVVVILGSGYIIDGIVWFGVQAAKWTNSVMSASGTDEVIPGMGKADWWAKPIIFLFQVFTYIALWVSEFAANILIFLRGVQLYIVKAVLPMIVAFFVSEELRSIAVGIIKYIMGLVLQGVLLVIIIGLIPVLMQNDLLQMTASGGGSLIENVMTYVALICKYVAIIILIVGSQGMAKRFMGAM
jgi:hypothetical protein